MDENPEQLIKQYVAIAKSGLPYDEKLSEEDGF
jgi:hypothetical protein